MRAPGLVFRASSKKEESRGFRVQCWGIGLLHGGSPFVLLHWVVRAPKSQRFVGKVGFRSRVLIRWQPNLGCF